MANRKGCEWRSGEDADCTPPTPEPGCCAGGGVCENADNSYCLTNRQAKKAGCEWISGADADCAPLPGCCYGADSSCWNADQSFCGSRQGSRAGCEWIVGPDADTPPDCTPPTPEPGCCFSDTGNSKCDVDDKASCEKMARRGGCEWISGKDATCDPTTSTSTTTTPPGPVTNWCNGEWGVDGCGLSGDAGKDATCGLCGTLDGQQTTADTTRPDSWQCGGCDEGGCCFGDPTSSYWYRCDPRAEVFANTGWIDWITVEENCKNNAMYGCVYVAGASVENGQCKKYESEFDGCCVKGDPTNTKDWAEKSDCEFFGLDCEGGDDCAVVDGVFGKTVCETWGAQQRRCVWRAGASGDQCKPNVMIACDDQSDQDCINGGFGVSEYHVACNGDSSCRAAERIEASSSIDCHGARSCRDSGLVAASDIDCGAEESCAGGSMEAGGTMTCGGARACVYSPSISAGKLYCRGEESCASNTNEVHASNSVVCEGQRSCYDMSALVSASIECTGRDSCMGSTLLGATVTCSGKQSCQEAIFGLDVPDNGVVQTVVISGFKGAADATLYNVGEVQATGATSLSGANVRTNTGSTTVILSGRQSGKNGQITCEGDAQCTVLCNDEACDQLTVFILGGASVEFGTGTSADSFTELDCFSNPGGEVDRVTCPMIAMSAAEENAKKAKTQMAPVTVSADQRADSAAIWMCDTASECEYQEFNNGDFALCSGARGCYYSEMIDVYAQCAGDESCRGANLVHGTAQCIGSSSCTNLQFGDSGDISVTCAGTSSCSGMQKDISWSDSGWAQADRQGGTSHDNDGTQQFTCSGYASCSGSEVLNVDSCPGAASCQSMIMDLTPGVECGGDSSCNTGWFYDNAGDIDCSGYQSCISARLFKSDDLYCGGEESCRSARIYGPNRVYALGVNAMQNAMINTCHTQGCDTNPTPTLRDITVYAYGSGALSGTELRCYSGATCDVLCHGDACRQFRYNCYDGATCNCVGDSCPNISMMKMEKVDKAAEVMAVGVELEMAEKPVVNEQLVLLVGAGAVVSILAGVYYIFGGGKNKNLAAASWDDEE